MSFRQECLTTKTPVEAYKACPYCKSKNLTAFEGEVFCRDCDWDSIAIHAELTPFGYVGRSVRAKAPTETLAKHSASIHRPAARQSDSNRDHTEVILTCAN